MVMTTLMTFPVSYSHAFFIITYTSIRSTYATSRPAKPSRTPTSPTDAITRARVGMGAFDLELFCLCCV